MAGISRAAGADTERVDWVDIAKGLCIILVVMVHATLGVEIAAGAEGFMHQVVAWARPFRMPDFFLISGLFLSLTIDKPWRRYLDRKVVHFAYFYVLWLTIQFAFKAPGIALERGATAPLVDYLLAFVQPFGTLWFIYILPLFFLFTRLVRTLPVWFVFAWAALLEALGERLPELCGDCQRRARTNPLRIFDCKVPADQPIIDELPHSVDYLCDACRVHFDEVKGQLDAYGLPYRVSHRLVRGLDYYTRTTFEILAAGLGAQNALLGGGRYDYLVKQLGGPDRAGIGFAAGLERLVLALPEGAGDAKVADAFVVAIGAASWPAARVLARDLRRAGLTALVDYDGHSSKSQMKRANRSGARRMLILGEDELARQHVTIKEMETGHQHTVDRDKVVAELAKLRLESPE